MAAQKNQISLDDARQTLQKVGLRRTASRVAVLRKLAEVACPMSHVELSEHLTPEGYDRSTIYRCLLDFVEAGLAARIDLGDHVWRFALKQCGTEKVGDHPHFLCIDCGEATCLPEIQVRVGSGRKQSGAKLGEITEVILKGHCPKCAH